MSIMNMFLQSLLEAPGDNARTNTQNRSNRRRNQNDDADNQTTDTDTTETNEEGEDNQDGDDTEGTEEEAGEDNDTEQGNEDEAENEDEQNNEEETGDDETEGEDNEGEGDEDDFSMNPDDEGEEDNEPPPDGLTDPDDDGSNDASSEDEGETNIHTNVLNLSKLDRLLAKRKCLSDFYDLRTSVDTFRSVIENNEAIIDPDVRQAAVRDLNKLYTSIGEYLMYRFGYTNYEENLQNYFIFIRSMNDIVKVVGEKGMKNPNKT